MPLVNAHYPHVNREWVHAGTPSGYFAESVSKLVGSADCAIAATGVELDVLIPLDAGTVVSNITFVTGGTAAATPTAGYAVLRDSAGVKLAQTADFTSTARAANTEYTVALASPYTVPAGGVYRVGISFTAGTVPTLRGANLGNAAFAASGTASAVTHGSAVGGTAPATTATPANASVVPYFRVS